MTPPLPLVYNDISKRQSPFADLELPALTYSLAHIFSTNNGQVRVDRIRTNVATQINTDGLCRRVDGGVTTTTRSLVVVVVDVADMARDTQASARCGVVNPMRSTSM
jgi:hypothetical protein